MLGACATTPPDDPQDPLETLNRRVFDFNLKVDDYVLQPLARGYRQYVPDPVQAGVRNFLDNLFYPTTIVNGLLQGKFQQASDDLARFVVNTTEGWLGFADPATGEGARAPPRRLRADPGRLGRRYRLVPDAAAPGPDHQPRPGRAGRAILLVQPTTYISDASFVVSGATGVDVISSRADALDARRLLDAQADPYLLLRTVYLQKRLSDVYDGNPPPDRLVYDPPETEPATSVDDTALPAPTTASQRP